MHVNLESWRAWIVFWRHKVKYWRVARQRYMRFAALLSMTISPQWQCLATEAFARVTPRHGMMLSPLQLSISIVSEHNGVAWWRNSVEQVAISARAYGSWVAVYRTYQKTMMNSSQFFSHRDGTVDYYKPRRFSPHCRVYFALFFNQFHWPPAAVGAQVWPNLAPVTTAQNRTALSLVSCV